MKFGIILILAIGIIGFWACTPKTSPKITELDTPAAEELPPGGDVDQIEEVEAPAPRPAFGKASIRKTACYGKCPVFELTFDGKGKAYYNGKKHVKRLGNWEADLSRDQIASILEKAQTIDYFDLANSYPTNGKDIVDFPYTITYLKFGPTEKSISNNVEAPDELYEYENFLIKLGEQLDWKKVNPTN